jgi:hypothetical protein
MSGKINVKILITSSCVWDALDSYFGTDEDWTELIDTVE